MENIYHLLTYYDKIPINKYKYCSPFLMDPEITSFNNKHVLPSYGYSLSDSFTWCWALFTNEKDYYKIHKNFNDYKISILKESVAMDTIKMLSWISKNYQITIKIHGDNPKQFIQPGTNIMEILRIKNTFHLLLD